MTATLLNPATDAYTFDSGYFLQSVNDELTVVNTGGTVTRGGSYTMGSASFGAGVALGPATGYLSTAKSVRNCGPEAGHSGTQYFGFMAWIPSAIALPVAGSRLFGRMGATLNASSWWINQLSETTMQLMYRSATTLANVTTQVTTLSLVDGDPLFIAGALDSNGTSGVTTRLFVNGVSATGSNALNMRASTAPLLFGYDALVSLEADVTLAQFALYNSATTPLSIEMMQYVYNGGSFRAGPPFSDASGGFRSARGFRSREFRS